MILNTFDFGPLKVGNSPVVMGVLSEKISFQAIDTLIKKGVKAFECRIDQWGGAVLDHEAYLEELGKLPIALLGTIRLAEHNNQHTVSSFNALLPGVDGIDIEVESPILTDLVGMAKYQKKVAVISYHDFEGKKGVVDWEQKVEEALDLGADIVKLAIMLHSFEEAAEFLKFTYEQRKKGLPLIVLGMGEYGVSTRYAAPLMGSFWTYGFTTQSVAPGQVSCEQLCDWYLKAN